MATAKTIEDYKRDYEAARLAGDAAGMKAANDGANAIRAAQGVAAEYATADIAKVAGQSSYTPLNATSAAGINRDAYDEQVKKQQAYVAANPSAARPLTPEEADEKYSDVINSTVRSGYYTQSAADAQKAAAAGLGVTPTSYNGQDGWYQIDRAKRAVQAGTSGADEGLLDDYSYAIVQQLKQDFAEAQKQYNAALAAGNTAAAVRAQQAMDNAHLEAERVRAGYGYSGGADGSMYITYGTLDNGGGSGPDETGESRGWKDSGGSGGSKSGAGGSDGYDYGYGTGGGSVDVPQGGDLSGLLEDYSQYLEQMYAAKKAGALAQLQAAYESNLAALDRAGADVSEQYQAARNSTAGASELAKRNFAEYAAASGLNSGTGGQAELARSVTLQNGLNTIDTAEADTLADLELRRADAETQYNSAIAQAEAEGDYALAAALYQEKVRVQNALIDLEVQQQKLDFQRYQLQYQAQRDQVSDRQFADKLRLQAALG